MSDTAVSATWFPELADGSTTLDRVVNHRPAYAQAMRDVEAAIWAQEAIEPEILELCRLRIAQLLGAGDAEMMTRSPAAAELDEALVATLRQWPTAPGFTDEIVDGRPVGLGDVASELSRAMLTFMQVAYPGKVDLVTRELVRIYSGRESHCTICKNLRLNAAIDRGFVESMVAHLDDFDAAALEPHQQAALRLAHAFLGDPGSFRAADRDELLVRFTAEQVAELLLDLVRFRPGSKLTVASGTEPAEDVLVYS